MPAKRGSIIVLAPALFWAGATGLFGQGLFDIPLRINMGGSETVDSKGNTWLGDGAGAGDPLNIRPDDGGGANWIENWSQGLATFQPDSLAGIGFDPAHLGDQYIFDSIRWDLGADGVDFILELPVPNGIYVLNLYFIEGCCPNRHFKLAIQGAIADPDVNYLDYDPVTPAVGRAGRLRFPGVAVNDEVLEIGLLPCPECPPPPVDTNAIISALELLPDSECTGEDFNFICAYQPSIDRVTATWDPVPGADAYRVLKNGGVLFDSLPPGTTSFTDANPRSGGNTVTYVLQALDGGQPFSECRCVIVTASCPGDLSCIVDEGTGRVTLSWQAASGVTVTGFEVLRDGVLLDTLPGTATSYVDQPSGRGASYLVAPLTTPPDTCGALFCSVDLPNFVFQVPFRVNSGGPETVDAAGNVWFGDQGAGLDPLMLRPDDAGGANTLEAWCDPSPASLAAIGFDPAGVGDALLFRSIRWDDAAIPGEFVQEIPVADGTYTVNLYFCESCCDFRHFKVEIQGEVRAADVHRAVYADAFHQAGKLTIPDVTVSGRLLRIGLLPCPECPGAADTNAILAALEVLPGGQIVPICPADLFCSLGAGGQVNGSWSPPRNLTVQGYEVRKDGALLTSLPGSATSFTDTLTARAGEYQVVPITPPGEVVCRPLSCTVVRDDLSFTIPLRINMGGQGSTDSRGRRWIGDGAGPADILGIRPDDRGGTNTIQSWCDAAVLANSDSLQSLGLDPANPADLAIFDSIRWDLGDDDIDLLVGEDQDLDGGDVDYRLELPVPNGTYDVNLYYTECCCPQRHFQVEVQGELIDGDVSLGGYSQSMRLGRTGRLSAAGVAVTDGLLRLRLPPCPSCPGFGDGNAILSALEVLAAGSGAPRCGHDLVCTLELDGSVSGVWLAPEGIAPSRYEVYRNGMLINTLPGTALSFTDDVCARAMVYEVVARSEAPGFLCPGMKIRCTLYNLTCPFEAPVRINMGGPELIDSQGRTWLSDAGQGLDPLEIRPDDLGGQNAPIDWEIQNFQPASLEPLGFDPDSAIDRSLLSTIRWDVAADGIPFLMELPLDDGIYSVNLYFVENFWNPPEGRHFRLEMQGAVIDEDLNVLDYSPSRPERGWAGRLSFEEVEVEDGFLRIGLLPCDPAIECPGAADTNAIISLLEVIAAGPPVVRFVRGDADSSGVINLTDGIVVLNFLFTGGVAPKCMDASDTDDQNLNRPNITDAIRIFNWLFTGGPAPLRPAPTTANYPPSDCGVDPTPDDGMDCQLPAAKCQ